MSDGLAYCLVAAFALGLIILSIFLDWWPKP